MKNKRKQKQRYQAPPPTPSPPPVKGPVDPRNPATKMKAIAEHLLLALNGSINQTSAILQRRLEEGFAKLEHLINERNR